MTVASRNNFKTEMDQLRDYDSDSSSRDGTLHSHVCVVIVDSFPESCEEKQQLGFQRYTPHVQGNWPGHLYLPLCIHDESGNDEDDPLHATNKHSLQSLLYCASQCVQHLAEQMQKAVSSEPVTITIVQHFEYPFYHQTPIDNPSPIKHSTYPTSLHISLCKPFFLQQHNIQSFITELNQRLHDLKRFKQGPLLVSFESLPTYSILFHESDTSRAYLTLSPTEIGFHQVLDLIRKVMDPLMAKYGCQPYRFHGHPSQDFIGNARIHVTVASILGDNLRNILNSVSDHKQGVDHYIYECNSFPHSSAINKTGISFLLQQVVCVLGNNYHTFTIP